MFIDMIFILALVGILVLGFFQGLIRLSILLVTFYLSVVLASLYFTSFGYFLHNKFGSSGGAASIATSQYLGFVIILLIGYAMLAAAGLYTFREVKMPGQLEYVDRISGVFIALILGALFLGIFAIVLWNLMIVKHAEDIRLPIMKMLGRSVRNSFLLGLFSSHILPRAYNFADPILPDAARIIFAVGE